jgi:hypothetical protein
LDLCHPRRHRLKQRIGLRKKNKTFGKVAYFLFQVPG